MIHTKFVVFPLEVLPMRNSITSTTCVTKLCNTAKRKCGRNTKCSITLPVKNGKFRKDIFNITDTKISQCESESVIWSQQGARRGILSVRIQNPTQVHAYNGLL